jgi:hypothetical protein
MFTTAVFITSKIWKQQKGPPMDEWINKCGVPIQWNTT